MNAVTSDNPRIDTENPTAVPNRFVLSCFLFFFVVIGAIALGDLVAALFR